MLDNMTTGAMLRRWAGMDPAHLALIDAKTEKTFTYQALDSVSDGIAGYFQKQGITPGQVVAYVLEDSVLAVMTLLALGKIGAVWTPLNPSSKVQDWERQIEDSHSAFVVYEGGKDDKKLGMLAEYQRVRLIPVHLSCQSPTHFGIGPTIADYAGILYTSGTTGQPKGAWHTHETLWGWHYSLTETIGLDRDDCLYNPYPYFHMGGVGFTLAGLQTGATVVMDAPFNAKCAIDHLLALQCTHALMVPTMVQALIDLPAEIRGRLNAATLRYVITTSAPLLAGTRRDFRRSWPAIRLSVLYSATEAIFSLWRDPGDEDPRMGLGRPAFGMEITVLDDGGAVCPPGVVGTIYARGVSVFKGYRDQSLSPDMWITCHDMGYLDASGEVILVDRESDVINSGGEKISSLEVENCLRAYPGVREVAVIGIPDRYWGESVYAAVVASSPALTVGDLLAYARQELPAFKVPKQIEIVSALPKTDTGKILKRALRAR